MCEKCCRVATARVCWFSPWSLRDGPDGKITYNGSKEAGRCTIPFILDGKAEILVETGSPLSYTLPPKDAKGVFPLDSKHHFCHAAYNRVAWA